MTNTIVIVEDEPDTAEMFSEMMRLSGYKGIHSYGGRAAISLIANTRPAAIILDVMLPSLSGYEILHDLRRDPQLAKIPVVMVSGRAMPEDVRTGLAAGAWAYLTKPVSYQDLKETVDQAIRQTNLPS